MIKFVAVQGTDGWVEPGDRRGWWHSVSRFAVLMASFGCDLLWTDDPFVWSTEVNGWQFWRRWSWFKPDPTKDHRSWRAGAKALRWKADQHDHEHGVGPLDAVCHSHGGNVWAYAAGVEGVRFRHVVLMGTPLRGDMIEVYKHAIANSESVLFVTDPRDDTMQFLGRVGDGAIGEIDLPPGIHVLPVDDMGHSGALYDPDAFMGTLMSIAVFLKTGQLPAVVA